eukprot:1576344-Pyramimonas_sp.AAC.1
MISADLLEAKMDPAKAAVLVVGDFNFGDRLEHCHFGDDAPPRSVAAARHPQEQRWQRCLSDAVEMVA